MTASLTTIELLFLLRLSTSLRCHSLSLSLSLSHSLLPFLYLSLPLSLYVCQCSDSLHLYSLLSLSLSLSTLSLYHSVSLLSLSISILSLLSLSLSLSLSLCPLFACSLSLSLSSLSLPPVLSVFYSLSLYLWLSMSLAFSLSLSISLYLFISLSLPPLLPSLWCLCCVLQVVHSWVFFSFCLLHSRLLPRCFSSLSTVLFPPGHLRPVKVKPVGRIFEISDSNPYLVAVRQLNLSCSGCEGMFEKYGVYGPVRGKRICKIHEPMNNIRACFRLLPQDFRRSTKHERSS